jgi:hypothetical protein
MDAASAFAAWDNFYVIVGSSAGALTGLQFVVMALVAERPFGSAQEINAFGTPTVVHFGATLLISAILAAPWHRVGSAGVALALCGAFGCVYSLIVVRRTRRMVNYHPTLDDWLWFVVLPLVAYVDLLVSAIVLQRSPDPALFAISGAALVLLFVGIRNAWDTVIYVALVRREGPEPPEAGAKKRKTKSD